MKTSTILKLEWDSTRTSVNIVNGMLHVHGDYPIITDVKSEETGDCSTCGRRTAPNGCPDASCVGGTGYAAGPLTKDRQAGQHCRNCRYYSRSAEMDPCAMCAHMSWDNKVSYWKPADVAKAPSDTALEERVAALEQKINYHLKEEK